MKVKRFLLRFWKMDSMRKVSWIERYLKKDGEVMDLGSGPGWVTRYLRERGYQVTPIDVVDMSVAEGSVPMIYDGNRLPFRSNRFDVCLILTVLHHSKDPRMLLREARRTSKRIVIIEDIHRNPLHGMIVKIMDSLVNMEFIGHPHNNMDDKGWKDLFLGEGFALMETQYHRIGLIFDQAVYLLEC